LRFEMAALALYAPHPRFHSVAADGAGWWCWWAPCVVRHRATPLGQATYLSLRPFAQPVPCQGAPHPPHFLPRRQSQTV